MMIRCIHCGKEFPHESTHDQDGRKSSDDILATCVHCGGVFTLLDPGDSSLPSEYVQHRPNMLLRGVKKSLRLVIAAVVFFNRSFKLQAACYLLILGLCLAYLLDYSPVRLLRKIPFISRLNVHMALEDVALEHCKEAMAGRLNNPKKAKYPWSYLINVEYLGDGNYRIKSYVDDLTEKGDWFRIFYTCMLETQKDRVVVKALYIKEGDD